MSHHVALLHAQQTVTGRPLVLLLQMAVFVIPVSLVEYYLRFPVNFTIPPVLRCYVLQIVTVLMFRALADATAVSAVWLAHLCTHRISHRAAKLFNVH